MSTDRNSPNADGLLGRYAANLDGFWVSFVTEDWRFRMVTPPKGDYSSVPLNRGGVRVADAWDWQKDQAAGLACKAYGAAGLMRIPGRGRLGSATGEGVRGAAWPFPGRSVMQTHGRVAMACVLAPQCAAIS